MPYRNLTEPLPHWEFHMQECRKILEQDVISTEKQLKEAENLLDAVVGTNFRCGDALPENAKRRYREAVEAWIEAQQRLFVWDELWKKPQQVWSCQDEGEDVNT